MKRFTEHLKIEVLYTNLTGKGKGENKWAFLREDKLAFRETNRRYDSL